MVTCNICILSVTFFSGSSSLCSLPSMIDVRKTAYVWWELQKHVVLSGGGAGYGMETALVSHILCLSQQKLRSVT